MEYPQGFDTPGKAACAVGETPESKYDSEGKLGDNMCMVEKDSQGRNLGGSKRKAIYSCMAELWESSIPTEFASCRWVIEDLYGEGTKGKLSQIKLYADNGGSLQEIMTPCGSGNNNPIIQRCAFDPTRCPGGDVFGDGWKKCGSYPEGLFRPGAKNKGWEPNQLPTTAQAKFIDPDTHGNNVDQVDYIKLAVKAYDFVSAGFTGEEGLSPTTWKVECQGELDGEWFLVDQRTDVEPPAVKKSYADEGCGGSGCGMFEFNLGDR